MSRRYNPADYPHGARCACCHTPVRDGQLIIDRPVAPDTTTPTCLRCDATNAPLRPGHPYA